MLCDYICGNVQAAQETRETMPVQQAQIGPEEEKA